MDIDMSVLRLMEREKDLPLDLLVQAIEEALITAYDKTDGAVPGAGFSTIPFMAMRLPSRTAGSTMPYLWACSISTDSTPIRLPPVSA